MSTEEDMFEYGFSDANDYVDHLMDQAESEDQKFSRNKQKGCDDANLGCLDPLSVSRIYQISTWF